MNARFRRIWKMENGDTPIPAQGDVSLRIIREFIEVAPNASEIRNMRNTAEHVDHFLVAGVVTDKADSYKVEWRFPFVPKDLRMALDHFSSLRGYSNEASDRWEMDTPDFRFIGEQEADAPATFTIRFKRDGLFIEVKLADWNKFRSAI